jgi:excisionase family DNA binding protein
MDDDEILTLDECAAVLKRPKSTIYRWTASRTIPFFRIKGSRRVFFSRRDIEAWWRAQPVPMQEAIAASTPEGKEARQNADSSPVGSAGRAFQAQPQGKTPQPAAGSGNGRGMRLMPE